MGAGRGGRGLLRRFHDRGEQRLARVLARARTAYQANQARHRDHEYLSAPSESARQRGGRGAGVHWRQIHPRTWHGASREQLDARDRDGRAAEKNARDGKDSARRARRWKDGASRQREAAALSRGSIAPDGEAGGRNRRRRHLQFFSAGAGQGSARRVGGGRAGCVARSQTDRGDTVRDRVYFR